jgi:hypothetical protein
MSEEVPAPTDEEIKTKALGFWKRISSLQGLENATERNKAQREWTEYLKGLGKNSRRTIARNAFWSEYDRLHSDG